MPSPRMEPTMIYHYHSDDAGGRSMDACKVARITGTDERGRFVQLVAECPDCHAFIESAPLRTAAAIAALMNSELAEHHRCAAELATIAERWTTS